MKPLPALILAMSCLAQQTQATDASSPQAVFKRLQEYVRSRPIEFRTNFKAYNDTLGDLSGSARFLIERPNLLRVEVSAGKPGKFSYLLVSDGQIYTIYNQQNRKFAQIPAPDSALAALYKFSGLATAEARVLDFFQRVEDVAAAKKGVEVSAGESGTIAGRQCDHFTIIDTSRSLVGAAGLPDKWDIWLEQGDVPLPCRTLFTSASSSQGVQTNEYSWSKLVVTEGFAFTPPSGSQKVVGVGELGFTAPD